MTQVALSDALGLNAENLKKKKLLRGNKLRGLIAAIRQEMTKFANSSPNNVPPTWKNLEKELDRIESEIKTTFREKAYMKLGMQISSIANEVAKVTNTAISNETTTDIELETTDVLAKARAGLIQQAKDMESFYLKQPENEEKVKKLKSIQESIEEILQASSEQELAECKKKLLAIAFPTSSQPQSGPTELETDADKMSTNAKELVNQHQKFPYPWRTAQVQLHSNEVEKFCNEVKSKTNIQEKTYASNLAKIHFTRLEQILTRLSVPATLDKCNECLLVIENFAKELEGLKTKVSSQFTKREDIDEIENVVPMAVKQASIPLQGIANLLKRVTDLHANCTIEKESQLNSLCLALTAKIGSCLQHIAQDNLLSQWDLCPAIVLTKSELTTALQNLNSQFK